MAKYGYTTYGTKRYGEIEANRVIYNSNISVFQPDYRTHNLSWEIVTPTVGDAPLTYWKIVKTVGGAPDNPDDGLVVTGESFPMGSRLTHVDTETLFPAGTEITYSFWVFNESNWLFCGEADAIIVDRNNDETTLKLARTLPGVWTNSSGSFGDATGEPDTNTDLWDFLQGLGYYYDFLRQKVSVINNMSDYRFFPHAFLPEAVVGLGFEYEPSLGDSYHRALYRSGNIINSLKGSALGLKIYSTALTHYGSTVIQGSNLMLDYNDSSFEESVGRWTTTRTIAFKKYENSMADFSLTLTPPTGILVNTTFPVRKVGFAALSGNNSIPVVMSGDPTTIGIPVKAGTIYLFTGYAQSLQAGTSTVSVAAVISWYDKRGALISSSTSKTTTIASTTIAPKTWYRFSSSSSLSENITAPSNAVYALPSFTITGQTTSGSPVIVDYLSFQVFPGLIGNITYGSGLEVYEDSRTVTVQLEGTRTNYLPNPGFDNGLGGWFPSNASVISDNSVSYFGGVSCKLTANNSSEAILISDWIPLDPNNDYIFSAYVKAGSAGKKAKLYIEFSSPLDAADQLLVTTSSSESYYNTSVYSVLSEEFTLSTSSFTRLSVTTQSPDFIDDGGLPIAKVAIIFTNPAANSQYWIDACLLESGDFLRPYFQGNAAPYPLNPILDEYTASEDLGWETRVCSNFISNPSFEAASTSGWSATSATLSSVTAASVSIPSKFGTYVLKAVPSAINNSASTTFYYPLQITPVSGATVASFPYGGEDIVASAYVYGNAGTYTISIGSYSNSFVLPTMTSWTRIHVVGSVNKPTTLTPNSTVTISYSGASNNWYMDGVQAEFGRTPSPFVDPSDTYTVKLVNPTYPSNNIYASRRELIGGGRSYYFSKRAIKINRLANTITNYLPLGSSWSIQVGEPTPELPEIPSSLLKSPSFENSLYGWSTYNNSANTTLTRVVSSGFYINSKKASLGASWVEVTNAVTSETNFGIYQKDVPIFGTNPYLLSFSARIDSSASAGTLTAYVNWTKLDGSPTDAVSGLPGPEFSQSFPITTANRWNYYGVPSLVAPSDAAYATITLKYTPTSRTTTNKVLFDRVIFRQV